MCAPDYSLSCGRSPTLNTADLQKNPTSHGSPKETPLGVLDLH
jgi:hypothetical protein